MYGSTFEKSGESFTGEFGIQYRVLRNAKIPVPPRPSAVHFLPGIYARIINVFLGRYFQEHSNLLKAAGIPSCHTQTCAEATIAKNAEGLRQHLLASPVPVTLFCHSKGGIDALECLIRYPETRAKVDRVISMQSPFYGSPVADLITRSWALKPIFWTGTTLLGGKWESLLEITTKRRREYMETHRAQVEEILSQVHFLCIGSFKKSVPWKFDTVLKFTRDWMARQGLLSDGLVTPDSPFLSGADAVLIEGLDHASGVLDRTPVRFNRNEFGRWVFFSEAIRPVVGSAGLTRASGVTDATAAN